MAWKNLKQKSLADALVVEHAALTELDDVHALLNWSQLEAHLISIHNKVRGEKSLQNMQTVPIRAKNIMRY